MGLKNDYNKNKIADMGRLLTTLIEPDFIGKYEIVSEDLDDTDYLYLKLMQLVNNGNINEAENILLSSLEEGGYNSSKLFRVGLNFYLQLNELSEDFIEENDFSKEEIADGLKNLGKYYGVSLGDSDSWL